MTLDSLEEENIAHTQFSRDGTMMMQKRFSILLPFSQTRVC